MGIAVNLFISGMTMLVLEVIARSYFSAGFHENVEREIYLSLALMAGAVLIGVIAHGVARREAQIQAERRNQACGYCGINLAEGNLRCPGCGASLMPDCTGDHTQEAFDTTRGLTRVRLNAGADRVNRAACEHLEQNGFTEDDLFGEKFFRKGYGILQPIWYIKIAYTQTEAYLYAWYRYHMIPGLFGRESKREWSGKYKQILQGLEELLSQK